MSMKQFSSKCLCLLRYVPYIIDENPKTQIFLSFVPTSFKDIIEFHNPKTLQEAMRKAKLCYRQSKKREIVPYWKNKRMSNFDEKRKCFKSNKSLGNNSQNLSKNNYQGTKFKIKTQQNVAEPKGIYMPNNYVKNNEHKQPIKCSECQGPHYAKYCPNRK